MCWDTFSWAGRVCRQLSSNVFACEKCGLAHVCGDGCTERVLDRSCDLPVCPISGRCFSRMVFPWEVRDSLSCHLETLLYRAFP